MEDILEGDELLTFDQFERYSEIDGTEDPKTAYKEYLRKHRQAALERYFFRHKGEGWLQERYDPFRSEAIEKRLNEAVATRSTAFMERFNAGTFTELVLEDGDDLHVEGERSSDTKSRSFPASMKLPDRLQGALQKRASVVTLSNISPMVTRDELEQLLKACSDKFISLELSLPMRDKGNYRMGWACFEEAVDLMPIVTEVEEKILYGDKIYCSAQKSFSLQFRIASPAFSNPDRLRRDLEQSMSLAQALDKRHEVECPLIEPLSGLSEKMQLDIVILYLRQVHFVCYYSAISAQGPNDLVRLAGDLYIRPVSTEGHLDENLDSFDQSISDLEETLIHSFSPVSEDSYALSLYLF